LKSQINPHFLFNSFNTLITIIEESPKVAVSYVEHLSDFYRSIMAYREQDFIPVQEEMALVRNFYFLLQKRYETGLQLSDSISSQLAGNVMPLSVQILVENAVKHNVISPNRPLIIEIFSDADGYITVRNNIQRKITPEASTHFGLQSLIRRYRLLGYKEVQVEDNAAYFTVRIPVITI
ncbi:MAG: sensor histidine kinase, partial [Saprospiraceae bacterium]|nr:sensor histidine kinase [Saprospiraceae bacterium]